ncbi:Monocarboxylate transporter 13 [Lamellibrachia satsuma]|nr:Monocarboxylate transporter 13 [Lamellibrachia satsuma]
MERASEGRDGINTSNTSRKNDWGVDSVGGPGRDVDSSGDFPTEAELLALKDSKRAWVVCFAACLVQVVIVGVLHIFGLFFIVFLEEFQCSKAKTAWIGSGCYGISMILGPLASMLINRWGSRPVVMAGCVICSFSLVVTSFATTVDAMYGTFTIIYGVGCCLAYTPTMCIAGDYFHTYMTLATGIMTSGSSIGTLVLSPLAQQHWHAGTVTVGAGALLCSYVTSGSSIGTLVLSPLAQTLITSIGWRQTFRIFAVMALLCVGCGWMFKPLYKKPKSPVDRIKTSVARRLMSDLHLWKNKVFIIWSIAITCVMFGQYIPYVHLVAHVVDIGIDHKTASMLLTILGATTATGRILFGKIVEYGYLNRLHMHQLSIITTGTGCMLLPLIRSVPGLVGYVVFVGLVDGCYVVLLPVLTSTLFVEQRVLAWGFLAGVNSITFTLGPPTAGWIYDATGSYNLSFHIAGIPVITGALILFFIPWAQKTATTTNIFRAARSYDEIADTFSDVGILDSSPSANRPPSSDDDSIDADIITIKTPTSYVIVDVAKNEVSQKPRSRRCTRDCSAATGDLGDEHVIGDGKIPDKLWEAVEVLRAQSKTIMSLDDVRVHETAAVRPQRSGQGAGGYASSKSPTISIAHSRLSCRDGSIRSRSIATSGSEHHRDLSELMDTFDCCDDRSSMHSSMLCRSPLTSSLSPRMLDSTCSSAVRHLSPAATTVGSPHPPISPTVAFLQPSGNSPQLTGSVYAAVSPSMMTSHQAQGVSPQLQACYPAHGPVSPAVPQLHTSTLSPLHPFDPLRTHSCLPPLREESVPFMGEEGTSAGSGALVLLAQSRSGTGSPTAGSEPVIFQMSDISLNGDFK